MRTIIFLLLFACINTVTLPAQQAADPFGLAADYHHSISFSADYFFGSNAVTNRFAKDYYLGHFLNNPLKQDVSDHLNENNYLGAGFNSSLVYSQQQPCLLGLKNVRWSVGVSQRNLVDARFKRDVFQLYFYGNKSYAGETAKLGDASFHNISYQQLFFSVEKIVPHTKWKLTWMAGLAFNKGQRYYSVEAPRASLYTAPDGYYLDVDLNITLRQSDSAHKDFSTLNGYGFSGFTKFIYEDDKQNRLTFLAENLGFITWNDHSAKVPVDSTFRFVGIDATDLFHFSDSVKGSIMNDSAYVQGFLTRRTKTSFTTPLPCKVEVSYFVNLPTLKSGIGMGANYVFFVNYLSGAWCEFVRTIHERHRLAVKFSFGGYTGWNAGLGYDLKAGKSWFIHVQNDFLSGMLDGRLGRAQGAFVSLSKFF